MVYYSRLSCILLLVLFVMEFGIYRPLPSYFKVFTTYRMERHCQMDLLLFHLMDYFLRYSVKVNNSLVGHHNVISFPSFYIFWIVEWEFGLLSFWVLIIVHYKWITQIWLVKRDWNQISEPLTGTRNHTQPWDYGNVPSITNCLTITSRFFSPL